MEVKMLYTVCLCYSLLPTRHLSWVQKASGKIMEYTCNIPAISFFPLLSILHCHLTENVPTHCRGCVD